MTSNHKNFSINIHQLLGRCTNKRKWKSQCEIHTCTIHGMTEGMLDGIRGVINNDVSCSDYINKKLILGRGSLAHLKLTKLGYAHDAHISLDAEGVLMVNIPHHDIRQQMAA